MTQRNLTLMATTAAVTAAIMLAAPAIGQFSAGPAPVAPSPADAPVQMAQLSPPAPRAVPTSRQEATLSYAPVVQDTAPAVVNVYSTKVVQQSVSPYANDPFFRQFFGDRGLGQSQPRVQQSLGSGVIVSADGVIVTNNHVIEGADEFKVVLSDRREFSAELVLADARTDLAVLKINAGKAPLPMLQFADTRDLLIGDMVLAIGNPFGVGQTVTSGIVSAQARTDVGISDYSFFIQTDASINPGNSGGALVDMKGRLIGINTAIFSRGGGSNGIGFAIPAEMVKRVVDAAVNDGRIIRPWLGAKTESVGGHEAEKLGLDRPRGVLVKETYPGGPADKAGLKAGDVVLSIDGREVFDDRGLKFLAATFAPGEQTRLEVLRGGKPRTLAVKLAAPPGATEADLKLVDGRNPLSGVEVADLSPALAEQMGRDPFDSGVLVNRVLRRSIAADFGLRPGDIVREVNGRPVRTSAELATALDAGERQGSGAMWKVAIERNGRRIEAQARI